MNPRTESAANQPGPNTSSAPRPNTAHNPTSKKIIWVAIAYAVFFLVTLWAAYSNRLPLQWLTQFPNYDKVGHIVLYCIPTYLGHVIFRYKHIRFLSKQLPLFPALFTLFTLAEELVQGFSPYRTLDAGDMICSLGGILLGYWLAQRASLQAKARL